MGTDRSTLSTTSTIILFQSCFQKFREFYFEIFRNSIKVETQSWIPSESNETYYPDDQLVRAWLDIYNQNLDEETTVDELFQEVQAYSPYLLLEQTLFFHGLTGNTPRGLRQEFYTL